MQQIVLSLLCNLLNIPLCHFFCICLSLCGCFSSSGIRLTASLCFWLAPCFPMTLSFFFFVLFVAVCQKRKSSSSVCLMVRSVQSFTFIFHSSSPLSGSFLSLLPSDPFDQFVLLFGRLLLRLLQHLCICFCHKYHGNHFTSWWMTHVKGHWMKSGFGGHAITDALMRNRAFKRVENWHLTIVVNICRESEKTWVEITSLWA